MSIEYPDLPMSNSAARITVRRNDESYGPYSIEEVNQLLMAGRLDSDDLAWLEGTPDWTQLRTIPGVIAVPPVPRSDRDEYEDDPECSDRLILPAFLMAFFVGALGVHRFYVGKTGSGIAMLVLTLPGTVLTPTAPPQASQQPNGCLAASCGHGRTSSRAMRHARPCRETSLPDPTS